MNKQSCVRKGKTMKRILAFVLMLVMVTSLWACKDNSQEAAMDEKETGYDYRLDHETFSVGYSRVDITPELAVPMAGYGNTTKRLSQNIQDYLYATSIAINDGQGNTVVFLTLDLQRASDVIVTTLRPMLAAETGLPESAFQITGTHTHSGPDVQVNHEAAEAYRQMLMPKLIRVVMESLEDLQPATMSVGSIEAEGLNFVRHYGTTLADGTVSWFGDNFGDNVYNETTVHASIADPTIYVVKFDREDTQDVCMLNWRAHPHWTGGSSKYNISSDLIGPFRECFEIQTGMLFAYYQGAAGNINEKSKITSENLVSDYQEHGARLAEYAVKCLNENMEPVTTGAIRVREETLTMKVNKTDDGGLLTAAKVYQSIYNSTGSRDQAKAAAQEMGYTINSQYAASTIGGNYKRADTEDRTYTVIAIGDEFAISLAPHEMFDRTMTRVEEASPYKYTLHFSYSNGSNTYMPDLQAWAQGGYEVDVSVFVEGSAELVEETFINMLKEMHEN